MRALLLALTVSLAACVGEADPEPYRLRPATADADSVLARLDARALEAAFARLDAAGYTATVTVRDATVGEATSGDTLSHHTIRRRAGGAETAGTGTPGAVGAVFDPVARLLPKEPPFQNPSTRGLYATTLRRLPDSTVAVALAALEEGDSALRRAAVAVDTTTGQVVEAQVVRRSTSAVYDEASNAYVRLRPRDGAWWPAEGELVTETDVPLSPARRLSVAWQVLTVDGRPLAVDSAP